MPIPIQNITEKVSIAGNGIVALMIAYFAFLKAREEDKAIKISIRGKYPITQTTAAFLVPSLSWNEILSVVPPGKKFIEALGKFFTEFNGGILLPNADKIIYQAEEFIEAVKSCGEEDIYRKKELLIEFSKLSLSLWGFIHETADEELRHILLESNYLACRERSVSEIRLRDGYRLDIYYDVLNFEEKLDATIKESREAGYQQAQLISPDELIQLDSSFQLFYENYSTTRSDGVRCWNPGAGVILRPGGCINTPVFLSKFVDYLTRVMGTYLTEDGKEKPCFKAKLGEVVGLGYSVEKNHVSQFHIADKKATIKKRNYNSNDFILCPGESVGTLRRFGLFEPPHARFAGFSLKLILPERLVLKAGFKMDYKCNLAIRTGVASSSVVQVGKFGESFTLGIGGMKAFLGLDEPDLNADYAIKASVYQLNVLNQIYAPLISVCLDRDTRCITLGQQELDQLIRDRFLTRWTGARACAYDGVPTICYGQNEYGSIKNLIVATHLSSGGVTNAPGSAYLVAHLREKQNTHNTGSLGGFFRKAKEPKEPKDTEQLLSIMSATRQAQIP
ncbi:FAD-binding oxidoreductase [Legionella longbeachae]|uniref:FAD-dependent oxidoreductase n=1 Tax=Legionella longbeachae TaxID=450 RepID=UPI0009B7BBCE|nr:FAD-dependent oxidoreductase [Legionella longbeachae]ARB92107.1 FAD-binding oxidoreductase [Legionella longbeachae]RZV26180.1 FAD-binding oxidoreductase [Legionella longbeachae]UAK47995.1 FAD-binding oxidoreductase [Legionella longbeachae]VEE01542.1 Uncharacterised protein [Legionella oakridgensis]